MGLNGPMIVGVSRLEGIEWLPSVEEEEKDKKEEKKDGLMEYVEPEDMKMKEVKMEEMKTENAE